MEDFGQLSVRVGSVIQKVAELRKRPEPAVESEALERWLCSISLTWRSIVEMGSPRTGRLNAATEGRAPTEPQMKPSRKKVKISLGQELARALMHWIQFVCWV